MSMNPGAVQGQLAVRLRQRTVATVVGAAFVAMLSLLLALSYFLYLGVEREAQARLLALRSLSAQTVVQPVEQAQRALVMYAQMAETSAVARALASTFHYQYRLPFDGPARRTVLERYYAADVANEYLVRTGQTQQKRLVISRLPDETVYAQSVWLAENPHPIAKKGQLLEGGDASDYSKVHSGVHRRFVALAGAVAAEDLYVIDMNGVIIYSIAKRPDFATSVVDGPWSGSGLSDVFSALRSSQHADRPWMSDIAPYGAVAEQASLFMGVPIMDGERQVGVLALRFAADTLTKSLTNQLRGSAAGLGRTADVYLVGADRMLRSASRRAREEPTGLADHLKGRVGDKVLQEMIRLQSDVKVYPVNTPAVSRALEGDTGVLSYLDWDGTRSWAAYAPLQLVNQKWAIVARMDVDEAIATLSDALVYTLLIMLAILLIIGLVAWRVVSWTGKDFVPRIWTLATRAQDAAFGSVPKEIPGQLADELGLLEEGVNRLIDDARDPSAKVTGGDSIVPLSQVRLLRVAERANAMRSMVSDWLNRSQQADAAPGQPLAEIVKHAAGRLVELDSERFQAQMRAVKAAPIRLWTDEDKQWLQTVQQQTQAGFKAVDALADPAGRLGVIADLAERLAERCHLASLNASLDIQRAASHSATLQAAASVNLRDVTRDVLRFVVEVRSAVRVIEQLRDDARLELTKTQTALAQSPVTSVLLPKAEQALLGQEQHEPPAELQAMATALDQSSQVLGSLVDDARKLADDADMLLRDLSALREHAASRVVPAVTDKADNSAAA